MSHNPEARTAWDLVIHAMSEALRLDNVVAHPAQSAMTGQQAELIFNSMTVIAHAAGNVRVIREQQSSKSQLRRIK